MLNTSLVCFFILGNCVVNATRDTAGSDDSYSSDCCRQVKLHPYRFYKGPLPFGKPVSYNQSWLQIHVAKASLEPLTLPSPPVKCWNYRCKPHVWLMKDLDISSFWSPFFVLIKLKYYAQRK